MEELKKIRGFEPVYGAPKGTKLPVRGSEKAAGYDFYAPEDISVPQGFSPTIWLNVKAYMLNNEYLEIKSRSSFMANKNLMLFCSGIIDADYYSNPNNDGNIGIRFLNFGDVFVIPKGDRICQGIFKRYLIADQDEVLGKRIGGFGSTGR